MSPLISWVDKYSLGQDLIQVFPVTIVRIYEGCVGLATNNGRPELLLPGVHVRNSASFQFKESKQLALDTIEVGPVHLFTVPSGILLIWRAKRTFEFVFFFFCFVFWLVLSRRRAHLQRQRSRQRLQGRPFRH